MNFVETLQNLYNSTSKITIYARNAVQHVDGEPVSCIGVRSNFGGYIDYDPVIDSCSFMICGDIFFSNKIKVKDVRDLYDIWTNDSEFLIALRAVSLTYPTATVDLGNYVIVNKSELDKNQTATLNVIRLN